MCVCERCVVCVVWCGVWCLVCCVLCFVCGVVFGVFGARLCWCVWVCGLDLQFWKSMAPRFPIMDSCFVCVCVCGSVCVCVCVCVSVYAWLCVRASVSE